MIGKIVTVSDLSVGVLLNDASLVNIKDILYTNYNNISYKFEVVEINNNVAKTIAFDSVIYLKKGIPIYKSEEKLAIEYSDSILGKVFDSYGNPINCSFNSINRKDVYSRNVSLEELNINSDLLLTGIKVIDFFAPIQKVLN